MYFSLYLSIYRFVFSTDPVTIQYSIFQLPCRNLLALISISLISEVVFQVTVQLPFHLKRYESDPFIHGLSPQVVFVFRKQSQYLILSVMVY